MIITSAYSYERFVYYRWLTFPFALPSLPLAIVSPHACISAHTDRKWRWLLELSLRFSSIIQSCKLIVARSCRSFFVHNPFPASVDTTHCDNEVGKCVRCKFQRPVEKRTGVCMSLKNSSPHFGDSAIRRRVWWAYTLPSTPPSRVSRTVDCSMQPVPGIRSHAQRLFKPPRNSRSAHGQTKLIILPRRTH